MACFLVPAGVAVVTTVVQKVAERKERKAGAQEQGELAASKRVAPTSQGVGATATAERGAQPAGKWVTRLRWLNTMLWGGVALLCLEHVWHGEVVPWPPFLTAMETPGQVGPMLHEMVTYGTTMTVVILAAWTLLVGIVELQARARRARETKAQATDRGA